MRNSPGCNCCEEDCVCEACEDSLAPDQFQVVITGIVNAFPVNCDACTNLNATHTLSFYSCTADVCTWRSASVSAGSAPSCDYYIQLITSRDSFTGVSSIFVEIVDSSSGIVMKRWSRAYVSGDPACTTLSVESIGLAFSHPSNVQCNWSTFPSCTVTAL